MDQDIWSSAWPLYTPPLSHYGVATAVGNVRNDGPELIEPSAAGSLF